MSIEPITADAPSILSVAPERIPTEAMTAALASAVGLMAVRRLGVWALAGLIAGGAMLAYVLSRTAGLPTDSGDIGNWKCSLGIAALSTEAVIVLLAAWRVRPGPRRPAQRQR